MLTSQFSIRNINFKSEQVFMLSALLVNGGNYLYNLILGRMLGPTQFADAAILITLLMVLSFMAMTFQLTVAKFTAGSVDEDQTVFVNFLKKISLFIGVILGIVIALFAENLQILLQTSSKAMFYFFAAGIPLYFLMSVNRGYYQGNKNFFKLSVTYQGEMLSRLGITIILLWTLNTDSSLLIAIGILASFIFGLLPYKKTTSTSIKKSVLDNKNTKSVLLFISITAFYEFTQIIINNSDIILVKHYFEAYEAGLYASLALIGRMVYFVAWMFVMILLPTVVKMKKNGENTLPVFFKYLSLISLLAGSIVVATYFIPEFIIQLMFGKAYLAMAPLLWKYALATSLFAISNVFVYYFLSLEKYIPVIASGVFGIAQVSLIIFFHKSLEQVVEIQIIAMVLLLVIQLILFFYQQNKNVELK
ncbi:oligosaccharide flippase family protein [Mesonia aestuariivivens]|uniref:Oligosaccharide flippase family protein n=1 Tax=Mesonia aestuariivivens TaxID=2796128 RepID=A0ABS6W4M0_9FLAO|nr:oligosaccharide flippase family protein [Mesonia aestuariivivens]MBW2962827.1 oligosaccharide flippase family protein [Mesonia aestuariivivens]